MNKNQYYKERTEDMVNKIMYQKIQHFKRKGFSNFNNPCKEKHFLKERI